MGGATISPRHDLAWMIVRPWPSCVGNMWEAHSAAPVPHLGSPLISRTKISFVVVTTREGDARDACSLCEDPKQATKLQLPPPSCATKIACSPPGVASERFCTQGARMHLSGCTAAAMHCTALLLECSQAIVHKIYYISFYKWKARGGGWRPPAGV